MARKPKPNSQKAPPASKPASSSSEPAAVLIFSGPPTPIYLGPRSAASNSTFLKTHNITHVLSIGSSAHRAVQGVTYTRLMLNDSIESSIGKVCDDACAVIDSINGKSNSNASQIQPEGEQSTDSDTKQKRLNQQSTPKPILVHCSAGVSRSPTIIAAYLIKRQGLTLKQALGLMIRARPIVCPNSGFLEQLKEMEIEARGECSMQDVDELPKKKEDRLKLVADE
ncbi:phosphatases II [Pluteus cervinus]|uniref:Phosphatases II n=1 Tax=Pluteus cervinus TaxID=181527 RepID=A0ACD3ALF1_9AGAR|nr:phosphatases II [Pluteus cervinus]